MLWTVAGGLLLSFALPFFTDVTLGGAWQWVSGIARATGAFLVTPTAVPAWALWTLILLACFSLVVLLRKLGRSRTAPKPTFLDYTRDSFDGIDWRWRWNRAGEIVEIVARCPNDARVLIPQEIGGSFVMGGGTSTGYYCEVCKTEKARLSGDQNAVRRKIIRDIDQKLTANGA